jgi:hypothetical protein
MERGDVARWPEPVNDSVVMISFDGRVVVPNLRTPVVLSTGVGDPARDHHRGVVFTDWHEVW